MRELSLRPLPVAFNASPPPEPPCGWSDRGLFPFVCLNSVFSRHFSNILRAIRLGYGYPAQRDSNTPVRARIVSGCWHSAFLGLFSTSCGPSFQAMDTTWRANGRGTGRPSVGGDGPVRRPCPNQHNKSERKENARQSNFAVCQAAGRLFSRSWQGSIRAGQSALSSEGPMANGTNKLSDEPETRD